MNLVVKRIKLIHKDPEFLPVELDASSIGRVEALLTNGNWTVNLNMSSFPKQDQKDIKASWVRFNIPSDALLSPKDPNPSAVIGAKLDYTTLQFEDAFGVIAVFELPWLGDGNVNEGIKIKNDENGKISFETGFHIV